MLFVFTIMNDQNLCCGSHMMFICILFHSTGQDSIVGFPHFSSLQPYGPFHGNILVGWGNSAYNSILIDSIVRIEVAIPLFGNGLLRSNCQMFNSTFNSELKTWQFSKASAILCDYFCERQGAENYEMETTHTPARSETFLFLHKRVRWVLDLSTTLRRMQRYALCFIHMHKYSIVPVISNTSFVHSCIHSLLFFSTLAT